jgi:glycosidase
VSKRVLITTAIIVSVYCSIFHFGCTKKKYNDLKARQSTEWTKNAVIYETNLRSYSKNGTFKALETQIPELKELGITVVSLTPIHPLGELNRRGLLGSLNAAKDFYTVNPEFGTLEDFKSLVSATHQQGLKIIFNLVINQAAWDSQLLMEHPDWFVHNEEGAIVSPNSECSDVAQIDYNQHELRKYMIAMMKFWVQEIGIDGFQCRSADLIPTDFWDVARNELDKIKPVLMISDSRLPEHHIKAFDMTCSWNMDNAIENIIDGISPASIINDSLNAENRQFPIESLHLRFNIKRDNNIEEAPNIEKSNPQTEKAIEILAFTLPGVPLVYCGDKAGNNKKIKLFNKLDEDLIKLRRNHPALQYGEYRVLQNSDSSHIFSFIRLSGKDSVINVVNFAHGKKDVGIQMPAGASILWKDQFSGVSVKIENSQLRLAILPMDFLMLVPSSKKEMQ